MAAVLGAGSVGKEYGVYQISMSPGDKHPFLLTYGFARIEVTLTQFDSPEADTVLTTKDIPCLSCEECQSSMVEQMLAELLDFEEETVAKWMFAGGKNDGSAYSVLDAGLRDRAPKSLSSLIQLIEASVVEFERDYDYFRAHGFNRISCANRKLPTRKIRHAGRHELLWMTRNSQSLFETPYETGINYLGKYYLPKEVETRIRVKSYDSYENRLLLGFLGELHSHTRLIYKSLKEDVASITSIEERLYPLRKEGYSLPALTLLRQCVVRENHFTAKLEELIARLRRLLRIYEAAFPGVKGVFSRAPRRTKVFQEIRCYSSIYDLMLKWLKFGDFALARENLALHSLRLDKLYEYYTLFNLLCWFHNVGFDEDNEEGIPITQAQFSLKSCHYRREEQVATLYKLALGNTRLRLYYQPVIYGDLREENGISLHRLSSRNPKAQQPRDSFWIPDFLLAVKRGSKDYEWHIFDAKYSKCSSLWDGYPKTGIFTEVVSKYGTDVRGPYPSDKISSVWLFSGRESSRNLQFAERSSWASNNYLEHRSGIGALTPAYSCLDEVLFPILGIDNEQTHYQGQGVAHTEGLDRRLAGKKNVGSNNPSLRLVEELHNLIEDSSLLYKSRWSESVLGISHPLLRKTAPIGREAKYYSKAVVNGEECFVYNRWLPNHENKLRSVVEKRRQSTHET